MSFEQFLKSPYMQEYKMPQARPQSDWLRGYMDRVHLFRLENIESDLLSIADKYLGVQVNASDVPHNNASTSKDAWFGISQEAQELILDLYEEDFELLGYEKKFHVS